MISFGSEHVENIKVHKILFIIIGAVVNLENIRVESEPSLGGATLLVNQCDKKQCLEFKPLTYHCILFIWGEQVRRRQIHLLGSAPRCLQWLGEGQAHVRSWEFGTFPRRGLTYAATGASMAHVAQSRSHQGTYSVWHCARQCNYVPSGAAPSVPIRS